MEARTPAEAAPEMPDEPMPGTEMEIAEVRDFTPVVSRGLSSDSEIRRMWRIGSALAQSGMFKDVESAAQAFAKIIVGHDLGLTPAQAMMGLHIVEDSPMLHYATLGGFIRSREGYDYRVREHDETKCAIEFFRHGESLGKSEFTMDDAKALGVKFTGRSGRPTMWKKQPKTMLLARALSMGVRWYMPEVLSGVPVYVEGEIEPQRERIGGSGDAEGIELGQSVEAVLIRAKALGHEGIADRAAAEMALGGQSPQLVDQWVANMHAELDKIDPSKQEHAVTGKPCGRADPTREGVTCELMEGHDGAHMAAEQTWQAFIEEADTEPVEEGGGSV